MRFSIESVVLGLQFAPLYQLWGCALQGLGQRVLEEVDHYMAAMLRGIDEKHPPPCNSDIIGIYKDLKIITIIPHSHYCWVGGSRITEELCDGCIISPYSNSNSPEQSLNRVALLHGSVQVMRHPSRP